MQLFGTDTEADAVTKIQTALQTLFPDPAVVTVVSQRWPGSSGGSNRPYFRFEFTGSLSFTDVDQVSATVTSANPGSFSGLGVTASTTLDGNAPLSGEWKYLEENATYELDYFGGHGGDGGGGGGRGSINSRANKGTKAFSPGGGGSGKKLDGDTNNSNQDGANGKVIIWY